MVQPARVLSHASPFGPVWRVGDTLRAVVEESAGPWGELVNQELPAWGLAEVNSCGSGRVELVSQARTVVPLAQVLALVPTSPASPALPPDVHPGQVPVLTDAGEVLFAAVPWLQLVGGSIPDGPVSTADLAADSAPANPASPEVEPLVPDPNLAITAPTPRVRRSRWRIGPMLAVGVLSVLIVGSWVWWRWQEIKPDCGPRPEVAELLAHRANALNHLDRASLPQFETGPLLAADQAWMDELSRADERLHGVTFAVANSGSPRCLADPDAAPGWHLPVQVSQGAYRKCAGSRCQEVGPADLNLAVTVQDGRLREVSLEN